MGGVSCGLVDKLGGRTHPAAPHSKDRCAPGRKEGAPGPLLTGHLLPCRMGLPAFLPRAGLADKEPLTPTMESNKPGPAGPVGFWQLQTRPQLGTASVRGCRATAAEPEDIPGRVLNADTDLC